jgi:beta-galactosidase/beta-glucuronidase
MVRQQWRLAGTWTFITDPKDQGEMNEWRQQDIQGVQKEVTVPHIWQREEELINYYGAAWYVRSYDSCARL